MLQLKRRSAQELMDEAMESAAFRGHGGMTVRELDGRGGWAECDECGMGVYVETNPAPNSIDIHGEAVALDCRRADEEDIHER